MGHTTDGGIWFENQSFDGLRWATETRARDLAFGRGYIGCWGVGVTQNGVGV